MFGFLKIITPLVPAWAKMDIEDVIVRHCTAFPSGTLWIIASKLIYIFFLSIKV
jgi:hypothetical protein